MGVKSMIETVVHLLVVGMFFTFLLQLMGCFVWYKQSKNLNLQSKQLHERIMHYEHLCLRLEEKHEEFNKLGSTFEAMYLELDTELTWDEFLRTHKLRRIT